MGNSMGWICPVCGRVYAPWVPSCECKGQIVKYDLNKTTCTADMKFETNNDQTQMICD